MTSLIITGKKRGGPRQAAQYLEAINENESVTVRQVRGFVAKTVKDALLEMWALAEGCKSKDFLYHATINPRIGIKLTAKQWKEAVDTLENNLGLSGHQRVVVEHIKKGRVHYHVIWNRVNPETGLVQKLSFDRRVCFNTGLQLSQQFGLETTPGNGRACKRGDIERGRRTGIDPRKVAAEITGLWLKAQSGQEFRHSLAKAGYILAQGDRGQFVVIDKAGSVHGLTRRIKGATAKMVRQGMADVDPVTLPTVAQAKQQVRAARQVQAVALQTPDAFRRRGSFRPGGAIQQSFRTQAGTAAPSRPVVSTLPVHTIVGKAGSDHKSAQPSLPVPASASTSSQERSEPAPIHEPVRPSRPQSGPELMWIEYRHYKAAGQLPVWYERWKHFLAPRSGPGLG